MAKAFGAFHEFTDACLSVDHPDVSQRLLLALSDIDPQLFLCWELQHYFEHRWHIKMQDAYTGRVQSVLILQSPSAPLIHESAEYVEFTYDVLAEVARLMHQLRHGTQMAVIEAMHEKQAQDETTRVSDNMDVAEQMDKASRKVQERLTGKRNISDPGWERGIAFDSDGVPFVEGVGAHNEKITKAI